MRVVDIEIFLQSGYSDLELASILAALRTANYVASDCSLRHTIVSDSPGLLKSENGLMVRTNPSKGIEPLRDVMIVLGGNGCSAGAWVKRLRAMRLNGRPVFLLSDAATEYIKKLRPHGCVTTHWQDLEELYESGIYLNLSTRLAETSGGITTCAGRGHTAELVILLFHRYLFPHESAEIASILGLEGPRRSELEQPVGASANGQHFQPKLSKALEIMEAALDEKVAIPEIADEIGMSVRQLERLFRSSFGVSPGSYYRRLRVRRAHRFVLRTNRDFLEIALACGFSSTSGFIRAYRKEFGKTPRQSRNLDAQQLV